MLTAKDTTTDKVIGLDAGADDYWVKPFELEELAARIRALLRRPSEIRQPVLRQGVALDRGCHTVIYAGNLLDLTLREYLILEYLWQNLSQVFTPAMLLNQLWEFDRASGENTVKTYITNLRRKLQAAGCQDNLIKTVYGIGYRLRTN